MKASELRIGNHILKNGVQSELTVELFLEYLRYTTPFDPIPLTEEWLLKFGFFKDVTGIYRFWKFECYDYLKSEDCFRIYFGSDEDNPIEITYIHELQNLYFALTNEELTLQS